MSELAMKEHIEAVRLRYLNGNRMEKGQILKILGELTGRHRKHLIRVLNARVRRMVLEESPRTKKARGRRPRYRDDESFCTALRRLWHETEQMCAPLFKSAIPDWLPYFQLERSLSVGTIEKLKTVSAATIGRILEPHKARTKRRCGTKPGSLLRTEIPIRTNFWDVTQPGFVEADSVAHCGGSMAGEFAWSVTFTDIDTTWTEIRCIWNKLAAAVLAAVQDVEGCLPFPLLGFDTDNGSEFINHMLVHYFSGKFISFTRAREYRKNDNAHVEQKNWTHVRQLLGYSRIDSQAVVQLLNELLRNEVSQLRNHFYPSYKLEEKVRIKSRIRRKYPTPLTPYQRVLNSPHVSEQTKAELRALHATLNPLELRREIQRKLTRIFAIVRDEHLQQRAS